jgi:hypothetical protein
MDKSTSAWYVWQDEHACDDCFARDTGTVTARGIKLKGKAGDDASGDTEVQLNQLPCITSGDNDVQEKCLECTRRARNCSFLPQKKNTVSVRSNESKEELSKLAAIIQVHRARNPDDPGLEHAEKTIQWFHAELSGGKNPVRPTGPLPV